MSNPFPEVWINCATTLNGAIDDSSPKPLVISLQADFETVDRMRSQCDAILIGARTLRADNPRLLIRNSELISQRIATNKPAHPVRVVLSRSGNLNGDAQLFKTTQSPVWIVVPESADWQEANCPEHVEVLRLTAPFSIAQVLIALKQRGCHTILLEGGGQLIRSFVRDGLVDRMRIAVSPNLLWDTNAPTWIPSLEDAQSSMLMDQLKFDAVQLQENMAILQLHRSAIDEDYWLKRAVELSRCCPQSRSSYAVGCVIVSKLGQLLASGYSLELGEAWHAEEVALHRCQQWGYSAQTLESATLYSSLEPCSKRSSRPLSCSKRIVESGLRRVIYGMKEPDLFVNCQGDLQLREQGVEVQFNPRYEQDIRQINRHLFNET